MADKNLSDIIVKVCKEQGIEYTSCNPNYVAFCNDAKYVGKIIHDLLALIDKLDRILDRHAIGNGFGKKLRKDIEALHETEHDLFRLATKLKNEEKFD